MKSLKNTVLTSIVLLTLLGDIFLFLISIKESRDTLKTVTLSDMINTSQSVGHNVTNLINEKYNFLENLTNTIAIKDNGYSLREKQDELDSINSNNTSDDSLINLIIGDELTKIKESINSVVSTSVSASQTFNSVSESIQITDALHSMNELSLGTQKLNETGATLASITTRVTESDSQIGEQIGQFKL